MRTTGHQDPAAASSRPPQAPGSRPLLGHAVELRRRPLAFMESLPAYGPVVKVRLGPQPAYVVCDPALTHRVLTDFRTFDRTGPLHDRVRAAMGAGLGTVAYQGHRRQRLLMQPAFHQAHLGGYVEVMRREAAAAMGAWRDGQVVDMVEEAFRITSAVTLKALFSSRIEDGEAEELRDHFDVFLKGAYTRALLPWTARLPTPANRRYARALAGWRRKVASLVAAYREAGGRQDDLMARLMAARDDADGAAGDTELSDQVAVLILAGGETTSAAVAWTLHLLGRHPQALAAVRAETDTVHPGTVPTAAELPQLRATGRAVKEAMRLYPPAWVIPRTCTRDTTLGGHTLPAGSTVIYSPYVLHRHPGLFDEPHRFHPDRWRSGGHGGGPDRTSYIPFGAGATKCIGEEFGTAEAILLVAAVVGGWEFSAPEDTAVLPHARAVLTPVSLPLRMTRRVARGV